MILQQRQRASSTCRQRMGWQKSRSVYPTAWCCPLGQHLEKKEKSQQNRDVTCPSSSSSGQRQGRRQGLLGEAARQGDLNASSGVPWGPGPGAPLLASSQPPPRVTVRTEGLHVWHVWASLAHGEAGTVPAVTVTTVLARTPPSPVKRDNSRR